MKKVLLLQVLFSFAPSSLAQRLPGSDHSREYYLLKSNNQRIAAMVLRVGGTAMALTGLAIAFSFRSLLGKQEPFLKAHSALAVSLGL